MTFTFQFNPDQPHQLEAIEAIVDILVGLPPTEQFAVLSRQDEIIPNSPQNDELAPHLIEPNLHEVQARHNTRHPDAPVSQDHLVCDDGPLLEGVSNDSFSCPHFTIEMETGTGKTYVYLRTLYELHRRYGLRKFLIVVPSVAIFEGVKSSFKATHSHFVLAIIKRRGNLNRGRRTEDRASRSAWSLAISSELSRAVAQEVVS